MSVFKIAPAGVAEPIKFTHNNAMLQPALSIPDITNTAAETPHPDMHRNARFKFVEGKPAVQSQPPKLNSQSSISILPEIAHTAAESPHPDVVRNAPFKFVDVNVTLPAKTPQTTLLNSNDNASLIGTALTSSTRSMTPLLQNIAQTWRTPEDTPQSEQVAEAPTKDTATEPVAQQASDPATTQQPESADVEDETSPARVFDFTRWSLLIDMLQERVHAAQLIQANFRKYRQKKHSVADVTADSTETDRPENTATLDNVISVQKQAHLSSNGRKLTISTNISKISKTHNKQSSSRLRAPSDTLMLIHQCMQLSRRRPTGHNISCIWRSSKTARRLQMREKYNKDALIVCSVIMMIFTNHHLQSTRGVGRATLTARVPAQNHLLREIKRVSSPFY